MAKPPVTATETDATKKSRKRAPENETPRDRFKRVVQPRISTALTGLRTLESMGPSQEYEFGSADVDKIEKVLTEQLNATIKSLRERKKVVAKAANLFD